MTVVWTVGHSTRTLEEFLALLDREGIRRLVDIRTYPGSRRYPQFNRETLAASLEAHGIHYTHLAALGGRRRPQPDSANSAWRNEGFRGYADHMRSAEFHEGIDALIAMADREPTTVMCAEAVPWRCHRTLVSDALVARGVDVRHIMDDRTTPHTLTKFAWIEEGEVHYGDPRHAIPGQGELFRPR